ncbi:hypothetical protein [Brevibacillus fulvus]|uniref:Uncharacterized protein n=1 Tax=Brevibacillus fulvus TaxID=1125967 RepID=A0A938Y2H3_9BACL|nr:hypothetical protein [Brevibacillus fulvus]MBM7592076.1 hypothetical protein [Brevibacillus fulvus]
MEMPIIMICSSPSWSSSGELYSELRRIGFSFQSGNQANGDPAGILLIDEKEVSLLPEGLAQITHPNPLILAAGPHFSVRFADQLQASLRKQAIAAEVIRLFFLDQGERAVIGGDAGSNGGWVKRLRRLLAEAGIITMVCRRVEAGEIAVQHTAYLLWKNRFFQLVGEHCDRSGANLQVVAQGLGMDKRIGQGWVFSGKSGFQPFEEQWLRRELQRAGQRTKLETIAIWADRLVDGAWLQSLPKMQVRWFRPNRQQKPNKLPDGWLWCETAEEALDQADLLLIVDVNEKLLSLDLADIRKRLRKPLIIDLCCCYPLQESDAYGLLYRSFGQNTNVWYGTDYNGI